MTINISMPGFKSQRNFNMRKLIAALVVVPFLSFPLLSYAQQVLENALPQGINVVSGSASSAAAGNDLNITTSERPIIEWNSFNIGRINTVNYIQPSSSSVALNRVVGVDPSVVYGTLNANGRVFVVNPNGIFFGTGSQVNVDGLVASTLDISNADFLAGQYQFIQNGSAAFLTSQGMIQVANGGYVALLSNAIDHSGSIMANLGKVALAAGEKIAVALDDANDISITINEAVQHNVFGLDGHKIMEAINNTGSIQAPGGKIILNAKVLNGIFDYAVKNSGLIQASSLVNRNGTIELLADGGNAAIGQSAVVDADYIHLSSTHDLHCAGTIKGGTALLDPVNTTISGNINADTTVWATNNITINGKVFLGANNTLNLRADHTSDLSADWDDGIGTITRSGNFAIIGAGAGNQTLNLQAGSGIGSLAFPIEVMGLASVSAQINPINGSGGIYLENCSCRPLTISSATTRNGDINLHSEGSIILAGTVNAGSGTITLNTTAGDISQTAGRLVGLNAALTGNGNGTLTSATNDIGTLTANLDGSLNYMDMNDVAIRSLQAGGAVYFKSLNGSISGTGSGPHLVANADSLLSTPNGTIGVSSALDVNVNGNLILDIGRREGLTSGVLTGTVNAAPGYIPLVLPSTYPSPLRPPGNIFFNAERIWPRLNTFLLSQAAGIMEGQFIFPEAEKLASVQVNTFDGLTTSAGMSGPVFLYHPLTQMDASAVDKEFTLDQGAYDFIEEKINKKNKGSQAH
jgi:filamentous hemagglutinin family protein